MWEKVTETPLFFLIIFCFAVHKNFILVCFLNETEIKISGNAFLVTYGDGFNK